MLALTSDVTRSYVSRPDSAGIAIYREIGEVSQLNWPLCNLSYLALDAGETAMGEVILLESLNLRRVHGYYRGLAYVFVGLARVRIAHQRFSDAAFWLGASRAEMTRGGQVFDSAEQADYDTAAAVVDEHVEAATQHAVYNAAAVFDSNELVRYALTSLR